MATSLSQSNEKYEEERGANFDSLDYFSDKLNWREYLS